MMQVSQYYIEETDFTVEYECEEIPQFPIQIEYSLSQQIANIGNGIMLSLICSYIPEDIDYCTKCKQIAKIKRGFCGECKSNSLVLFDRQQLKPKLTKCRETCHNFVVEKFILFNSAARILGCDNCQSWNGEYSYCQYCQQIDGHIKENQYGNTYRSKITCDCKDIYLIVPYNQKEKAKELGARWNSNCKKWYFSTRYVSQENITTLLKIFKCAV